MILDFIDLHKMGEGTYHSNFEIFCEILLLNSVALHKEL